MVKARVYHSYSNFTVVTSNWGNEYHARGSQKIWGGGILILVPSFVGLSTAFWNWFLTTQVQIVLILFLGSRVLYKLVFFNLGNLKIHEL